MSRIVIVHIRNFIFGDAVAKALREDSYADFSVETVISPEEVLNYTGLVGPYAVLLEVTGNADYSLEERLKLRDNVKELAPDCKVVLTVDENSEKELALQVRQAKKDGHIDQFIYGSISASYLTALMDTL